MQIPVFLAHGVLGEWDELIYLGIAVLFLTIMAISWVVSRMNPPKDEPEAEDTPERFKLE